MSGPILVTGGAGALGRVLAARLRDGGQEVVTASRSGGDRLLDVTDAASVDALVGALRPRAVVHLASALPGADADAFERVNVDGTEAVGAASARVDARLVLASSAAVYGVSNDGPSREDDAVAPTNPYGSSKARAEERLDAFGDALTAVSLRIFNVVGPGFTGALPARILDATAASPVALRNPDGFVRDYVHVDDVVRAIAASLDAPVASGHTRLNVGSGVPTSTRHLVGLLGPLGPLHVIEHPGADDRVWADTGRATEVLAVHLAPIEAGWFGAPRVTASRRGPAADAP